MTTELAMAFGMAVELATAFGMTGRRRVATHCFVSICGASPTLCLLCASPILSATSFGT